MVTPVPSAALAFRADRFVGLMRRLRGGIRAMCGADSRAVRQYLAETGEPKLHLGCGRHLLAGWLNSDRHSRAGIVGLDATRPLPFPAGTFAYVYSEHLLGSLSANGAGTMLRECFRVLAPGGKVRIATPDLAFLAGLQGGELSARQRRYVEWFHAETGTTAHLRDPLLAGLVVNRYMKAWGIEVVYDEPMLRGALEAAGFCAVTRRGLNESDDGALRGLANEGRMPPGLLGLESLVLEARKSEPLVCQAPARLEEPLGESRFGKVRGRIRRCLRWVPRWWRRADARIARRHFAQARRPKLHLGCGDHLLGGWLNTDLWPRSPDVARLDASRRLSFPDNAFAYVYSEYMLASLAFSEAQTMLSECHRVLVPGGKVRIVTTDLAFLLGLYSCEHSAVESLYVQWAGVRRLAQCRHSLCRESWHRCCPPGNSGSDAAHQTAGVFLNHHLHSDLARFVYDAPVLTELLTHAGFSNIVRCEPACSEDPALRGLANEGRMPNGFFHMECLTVEGTKPEHGTVNTVRSRANEQ